MHLQTCYLIGVRFDAEWDISSLGVRTGGWVEVDVSVVVVVVAVAVALGGDILGIY